MRLRAREDHSARIDALDMDVDFERGEEIRTEISCKFTRESLAREYAAAGLELLALVHRRRRPVRALADRAGRLRSADAGAACYPEHREVAGRRTPTASSAWPSARPADRPYVVANMVASADGRATARGSQRRRSPATADRELFHDLRTQVDAVMVGPATIAIERYGPLVARRRAQGAPPRARARAGAARRHRQPLDGAAGRRRRCSRTRSRGSW